MSQALTEEQYLRIHQSLPVPEVLVVLADQAHRDPSTPLSRCRWQGGPDVRCRRCEAGPGQAERKTLLRDCAEIEGLLQTRSRIELEVSNAELPAPGTKWGPIADGQPADS